MLCVEQNIVCSTDKHEFVLSFPICFEKANIDKPVNPDLRSACDMYEIEKSNIFMLIQNGRESKIVSGLGSSLVSTFDLYKNITILG